MMRMAQNRNKKGREHGTRVSLLCHFLSNSQLQIIEISTQKKQFQKTSGPGLINNARNKKHKNDNQHISRKPEYKMAKKVNKSRCIRVTLINNGECRWEGETLLCEDTQAVLWALLANQVHLVLVSVIDLKLSLRLRSLGQDLALADPLGVREEFFLEVLGDPSLDDYVVAISLDGVSIGTV